MRSNVVSSKNGVVIGEGAIVGACTLVINDIPAYTTVRMGACPNNLYSTSTTPLPHLALNQRKNYSRKKVIEDFLNAINVYSYHKCLLSANPPSIGIDKENMKLGLHLSKCYMARYTTDFDCGFETPWYYVIRDVPIDLAQLNSTNRYNINHGLKYFYIQKINNSMENVKELYRIYKKASERYTNFTPINESDFIKSKINDFENNVYYGAYFKGENLLCGYTSVKEQENVANFNTMKLDQDYFKFGLSYVLVFSVTEIYLRQKKFKYIHNGGRSIRHDTEMQNFLIKRLGFRKAYANLCVEYKFTLGLLIKICYPFRKLFNKSSGMLFHNVSALLFQERIARETNRLFV